MDLITKLFNSNEIDLIKSLYHDPITHDSLLVTIGSRVIEKSEVFLSENPLDTFMLICATADFADSIDECNTVAVIIYNRLKEPSPLPMFTEDKGMDLAEKCLTSLSFFRKALEHRNIYHGAPKPDWYRTISKNLFVNNNMLNIADHHEKWECFFEEMFI